mgnify:CR=1 FL=1
MSSALSIFDERLLDRLFTGAPLIVHYGVDDFIPPHDLYISLLQADAVVWLCPTTEHMWLGMSYNLPNSIFATGCVAADIPSLLSEASLVVVDGATTPYTQAMIDYCVANGKPVICLTALVPQAVKRLSVVDAYCLIVP